MSTTALTVLAVSAVVIALFCLYMAVLALDEVRELRTQLNRESQARQTGDHAHDVRCEQRWRAGAAVRRGQDTPRTTADLRLVPDESPIPFTLVEGGEQA